MSNEIYDVARYRFGTAQLNWETANLVLFAFAGTPVFEPTDLHIDDLTGRGATVIGQSMSVSGRNVSQKGYLQTAPILIPAVPVGPQFTHMVMALDAATAGEEVPLIFVDEAVELPYLPNGLDILIQPDWLAQRGWGRL